MGCCARDSSARDGQVGVNVAKGSLPVAVGADEALLPAAQAPPVDAQLLEPTAGHWMLLLPFDSQAAVFRYAQLMVRKRELDQKHARRRTSDDIEHPKVEKGMRARGHYTMLKLERQVLQHPSCWACLDASDVVRLEHDHPLAQRRRSGPSSSADPLDTAVLAAPSSSIVVKASTGSPQLLETQPQLPGTQPQLLGTQHQVPGVRLQVAESQPQSLPGNVAEVTDAGAPPAASSQAGAADNAVQPPASIGVKTVAPALVANANGGGAASAASGAGALPSAERQEAAYSGCLRFIPCLGGLHVPPKHGSRSSMRVHPVAPLVPPAMMTLEQAAALIPPYRPSTSPLTAPIPPAHYLPALVPSVPAAAAPHDVRDATSTSAPQRSPPAVQAVVSGAVAAAVPPAAGAMTRPSRLTSVSSARSRTTEAQQRDDASSTAEVLPGGILSDGGVPPTAATAAAAPGGARVADDGAGVTDVRNRAAGALRDAAATLPVTNAAVETSTHSWLAEDAASGGRDSLLAAPRGVPDSVAHVDNDGGQLVLHSGRSTPSKSALETALAQQKSGNEVDTQGHGTVEQQPAALSTTGLANQHLLGAPAVGAVASPPPLLRPLPQLPQTGRNRLPRLVPLGAQSSTDDTLSVLTSSPVVVAAASFGPGDGLPIPTGGAAGAFQHDDGHAGGAADSMTPVVGAAAAAHVSSVKERLVDGMADAPVMSAGSAEHLAYASPADDSHAAGTSHNQLPSGEAVASGDTSHVGQDVDPSQQQQQQQVAADMLQPMVGNGVTATVSDGTSSALAGDQNGGRAPTISAADHAGRPTSSGLAAAHDTLPGGALAVADGAEQKPGMVNRLKKLFKW